MFYLGFKTILALLGPHYAWRVSLITASNSGEQLAWTCAGARGRPSAARPLCLERCDTTSCWHWEPGDWAAGLMMRVTSSPTTNTTVRVLLQLGIHSKRYELCIWLCGYLISVLQNVINLPEVIAEIRHLQSSLPCCILVVHTSVLVWPAGYKIRAARSQKKPKYRTIPSTISLPSVYSTSFKTLLLIFLINVVYSKHGYTIYTF